MSSDSEDKPSFLSRALNFKWVDTKDRFWKVLASYRQSSYHKLCSYKHQTEATLKYGYDYFIETLEPYRPRSWSSLQAIKTRRDHLLINYKLAQRVTTVVVLTGGVFVLSPGIRIRLLNTVITGGIGVVMITPELINPLQKK